MAGNGYIMSSLDNALRILDILRTRSDIGVSEMSRLSGLGKSSAFNILNTLERRGYVKKSECAKYSLGTKFYDNGGAAESSKSLVEVAMPVVRRLISKTGATVWMGVLNTNGRVVAVVSEEGTAPGSPPGRVGFEGEANAFSTGKVLLAHLDGPVFQSIFGNRQFKRYTPSTIVAPAQLKAELKKVLAEGYAEDYDERYIGYGSVSVPVFDENQKCMAALTILAASETIRVKYEEYLLLLKKASKEIGWTFEESVQREVLL